MSSLPDPSQRAAIYAFPSSCVLVTAPPGYGKTFVMPRRIQFLLDCGALVPPARCLGLTFTNAAASEMLSRLEGWVPERKLEYIDSMTFHAFCYRVLRAYGNVIGLGTDLQVITDSTKKSWLRAFVRRHTGAYKDSDWYNYRSWETDRTLKLVGETKDDLFEAFWAWYQQHLLSTDTVDFNHLLWFTYELFRNHSDVLAIYRHVYHFLLVDEFQDTNPIQLAILRQLVAGDEHQGPVSPSRPVFIFGDDWQSIYRFLGAVPEQLNKAAELFGCQRVELTQDHRTESPSLILLGRSMRDATCAQDSADDELVPLVIARDPEEMAACVNAQVGQWVNAGVPLHEIAVFAREKKQLEEVRQRLAYPYVCLPDLSAEALDELPTFQALLGIADGGNTSFQNLTQALRHHQSTSQVAPGEEVVSDVLHDLASSYDQRFPRLSLAERAKRLCNEALLEVNWGQQLRKLCKERAFLGTLHSGKGLEFQAVIIIHLEKDSFPAWQWVCKHCSSHKHEEGFQATLEDEWRILYVGITRARKRLVLMSSLCRRNRYGRRFGSPISCLLGSPIWEHLAATCSDGSVFLDPERFLCHRS